MDEPINNVDEHSTPATPDIIFHGSSSNLHSTSNKEDDEVLSLESASSNQVQWFIRGPPMQMTIFPPIPGYFHGEQDLQRDIIQGDHDITPGNLMTMQKRVQNLRNIGRKLRSGRPNQCTSNDRNILMEMVNKLKELYPLIVGVPEVPTGDHDMMDLRFFSKSLELVATLLSKRSLTRLNVEKYIQFLLLLADELLDI